MRLSRKHITVIRNVILWMTAVATSCTAFAQGPNQHGLYVPPSNIFISDPAETPIKLTLGTMPLARIQKVLDDARATDASSPIVLTLTGTYLVIDQPLRLPSKTSLVLYGSIHAVPGASAASIISVSGQSQVAISGGFLDAHGANLSGIDVENSSKVNIDAVTVTDARQDGIVLQGGGNTVWDSGSAITRCEVSHSGGNGITIGDITQALLLDSFVHHNSGAGIRVSSAYSSIVNNVSRENDTGIRVDANDDLISDNQFQANRNAGIILESSSANIAVLRNSVLDNAAAGIDFDGRNNLIYENTLRNANNLTDRSTANWIVGSGMRLDASQSQYFYPPTIDNRHADTIINGLSRTDVAIDSSTLSALSAVQQAYDTALQQHPNDVIVLTLTGQFTVDAQLLLQSHTAVILDGLFQVPAGSQLSQVVTAVNPSQFISFTGGTIDLGGRSMAGIFFPSTTLAFLDHITVQNGGQRDVRQGGGMIHLQNGGGYNILHANTVNNSGGRCIWTQQNHARYVVLENYLTNCNMDGVDFDSSTSNSFAIGNNNVDNIRYGVFIEQSDSFNRIYGNNTTTRGVSGIPGHGIGIYNNATSGATRAVTDKNTIFSNVSDIIANGLRVGSISTATGGVAETAHSFLFNNVVRNSRADGILFDTEFPQSVQNYFSQTVLSGNATDINSHPSNGATPPEFFNPPPAINLALNQPVATSSSAPGSSAAAAVDGLAYTNWTPANEHRSWLTIDLGTSASFGRVTLKQTSRFALYRIELESSQDGSTFTSIPGTVRLTGTDPLDSISFASVSARFLRVRMERLLGQPTGFEEISVHPM
ncbi:MAG: right-handed parallel beta-helix repeat-containing protein [Steroidobacteraceae bacterium]